MITRFGAVHLYCERKWGNPTRTVSFYYSVLCLYNTLQKSSLPGT